jgi:hypothetical protein
MAYKIGRGPRQMYRSHGNVEMSVSTRAGTGSYPGGAGVMNEWADMVALNQDWKVI